MWFSGEVDHDNVIERVIVPSEDVISEGAGIWTVTVSSEEELTTETQAYSLVVTGPFGTGTALPTSSAGRSRGGGAGMGPRLFPAVLLLEVGLLSALAWLCVYSK